MSWVPRDMAALCQPHTYITTCGPQGVLFLQLIVQTLSRSRDDKPAFNDAHFGFTFQSEFDSFSNDDFHSNDGFGGHRPSVDNYDFIVVGAGSAGCVVANRLSEIPHWKVCKIAFAHSIFILQKKIP